LLAQHAHGDDVPAGVTPRTEHLVALRELLVLLPDELARAAVYYYLDEMTYDEIAQTMRCSRRHVANLLKRLLEWHRDPETRS
jgi:RNA polymerase sigma-70 factor (ECF subfamily)